MIAISSNSWFTRWIGLELNLLSFIPIVSSKHNSYSSEAALKYFLVQALGSTIILIGATSLIIWKEPSIALILASLLLKIGAAPAHFWFPTVIQGLSWIQCLTLTTAQKVAPIVLASYTITNMSTLLIILVASISSRVVGSLGGLNQTLLRKILAYSSINHMAWILAAISIRIDTWIQYILIYSLVSLSLIAILNFNQTFHFKQISTIPYPGAKMLSFLTLLSLGGLPPLIGFVPKLIIIKLLAETQNFIWLSILIGGTLLTLFYYIRLSITAIVIFTPKFKTFFPSKPPLSLSLVFPYINFFPLLFPIIIPLIY